MRPDDLSKIYVRCADGTMSPVSEFVNLKKIYGPANITRFNLFTSMDVSVTPNSGYSTGDGMKAIAEVAKETLPEGYGYEYSGLTRSKAESSNSTGLIFALCIVFVYLILSAQYESYILPLSVVLSIPFGLAGAFIFTNLFGHSNDIYMQISLIMLIGLLAKNAILIVQFALERRRTGMAIKYSAILGAGARLRPILMTSLAMVIGLLPLMFASGVGKNGNQTLGAAAVGGMLIGTLSDLRGSCSLCSLPVVAGEVDPNEVRGRDERGGSCRIGAVCQRRSRNEGYREEVITQCNFKGNNEKEFKYHHIGSRSALPEQLQDTLRKV